MKDRNEELAVELMKKHLDEIEYRLNLIEERTNVDIARALLLPI
jgi:hypothetical protein